MFPFILKDFTSCSSILDISEAEMSDPNNVVKNVVIVNVAIELYLRNESYLLI